MRKLILAIFFIAGVIIAKAQEDKNIADLNFLYQAIQKTPSYKAQLKGDDKYQQLYESLKKDLNLMDDFYIYQQLLKLIYPIKDNHLGLYHQPDSTLKFNYLKPTIDSSSLIKKYKDTPLDSVVGIYYSLNGKSKAVIYEQSAGVFYLQNLTTQVVEAILKQTDPTRFEVIRFLNPPVPYVLYRNVRYRNGRLDDLGYKKIQETAYYELKKGSENYEYKKIEDGIGYLRLSSFAANNVNLKKATDFFNQTKSLITEPNLIVDVRNNGGGAYKTSMQFISFLKNYKGRVFILHNGYTVSNAEQFMISLKGMENIITLGETSKGTITYGSNYGNTVALPSGRFLFYPTDMGGSKIDLRYENIGVEPDIKLNPFTEDWIIQTVKYINSLNKK